MRFEISNIDEKLVKKIKKYCVDKSTKGNRYTQSDWARDAHDALVKSK